MCGAGRKALLGVGKAHRNAGCVLNPEKRPQVALLTAQAFNRRKAKEIDG